MLKVVRAISMTQTLTQSTQFVYQLFSDSRQLSVFNRP
jgi:hypothetical protein